MGQRQTMKDMSLGAFIPVNHQATVEDRAPTKFTTLFPSDLACKGFLVELPKFLFRQRRGLHQDNRYSVLQYGGVQLGPWDIAYDGALNDVVGLCAMDHSWVASKGVLRLCRIALFYAILKATFALGHLLYSMRISGQLLNQVLAQSRASLPALKEILIGDRYSPHPLGISYISLLTE